MGQFGGQAKRQRAVFGDRFLNLPVPAFGTMALGVTRALRFIGSQLRRGHRSALGSGSAHPALGDLPAVWALWLVPL
jgi:hypothetical protein